MSLSDRRTFLLALPAAALAGCGFTPVYAPGSEATNLQGTVRMDDPTNEDSFDIVRQIEQRLGRPTAPIYGLTITPSVDEESLSIVGSRDITRFNLIGRADFAMRSLADNRVLLAGEVDSFTSYSATGTTVSTLTAERDARTRLMINLANLVVTRLIASPESLAL
ncbi:LPS assembly lipoprotein LptE [Dinoroseobacter sp. S124A]|uniref:LPS assembly lipoprotein LptE n=1 Tax=Dinoroseobacter sp. S124A TaxID=3415128 RepID=UPI003C7ED436